MADKNNELSLYNTTYYNKLTDNVQKNVKFKKRRLYNDLFTKRNKRI